MSRRRIIKDYQKLESKEELEKLRKRSRDMTDGGFIDEQFMFEPERKFPWRTAVFVMFLMTVGSICLMSSILILTGFIDDQDRFWALLIIGALMSIPGGYFGYIFLNIFLKRGDYTLDDIPILQ